MRYRTLDIAVCSGGVLVLVIPVTFHHRYAPRRQVRRNEINRKNTYFNRNLFGHFDIALKINTIREVFPRSAGNVQEIAIEVELMNIYQGSNTFILIFGKLTKSLKCDINFKKKNHRYIRFNLEKNLNNDNF